MFTLCSLSDFVKHMDGICQVCFHCVSTAWHGKKRLSCKFRVSYWILYLGILLVSFLRSSSLFLDLLLVFPHSSLVPRGQYSQERYMFSLLALLEVSEETKSSSLVMVLTSLVCKWLELCGPFSTGRLVWLSMSWSFPCPSSTLDVLLPLCVSSP